MKSFSIEEAIKFGWTMFKTRPWLFVGITAFTVVLSQLGNMFKNTNGDSVQVTLVVAIFSILASIANFLISIGTQKFYLKAADGENPEFKEIFRHAGLWLNVLLGGITLSIIVVGGFILLIIPGIIFAIMYGFQSILIIDKGMGPIDALKESARITKGVRWHLFLFALSLLVLNIIGAICLVVGLLVTIPVTNLAIVHVYRKLLSETNVPVQQELPVTPTA